MMPYNRPIIKIILSALLMQPLPGTTWVGVDAFERGKGKRGIGVHYVVFPDGHCELGRSLDRPGNHTKGHNYDSIGVGMVGGTNQDGKHGPHYGSVQVTTALKKCIELRREFSVPIVGMNQCIHTSNPYFDVGVELAKLEGIPHV